jgi:hypothetical protein
MCNGTSDARVDIIGFVARSYSVILHLACAHASKTLMSEMSQKGDKTKVLPAQIG